MEEEGDRNIWRFRAIRKVREEALLWERSLVFSFISSGKSILLPRKKKDWR